MNRPTLRALIARHTAHEGLTETPIDGLRLLRIDQPMDRLPAVYPPSMCCLVQGRKRAYFAGSTYTYDPDHYLCGTLPLPVEAEVPFASPEAPVLGVMLDLDTQAMAETVVAYEAAAGPRRTAPLNELSPGLGLVRVDDGFLTVLGRLLALLDDPVALHVLGSSRLRELLFAIVDGTGGPLVRRTFSGAHDITRVLTYVRDHVSEPLSVDDLARRAGMSRAVFHRRFKAATSFSPLQFIKTLRLSEAALQLAGGRTVGEAADNVGYTSASQFSREFRRQFGASPKQWAKSAGAVGVQAVGA